MQTEYRCKKCGGNPGDDESFDCPTCRRPIGLCAECGWPLWLSQGADLPDCDECVAFEGALLSREEQEQKRLEWEKRSERARLIRESTNARGRQLSAIVAEAYRAAGRPRKVTRVWTRRGGWGECLHMIESGPRRYEYEPATEAEWRAWSAWVIERDRLREQLGVNRGLHSQHHKQVGWEGPRLNRWEANPKNE